MLQKILSWLKKFIIFLFSLIAEEIFRYFILGDSLLSWLLYMLDPNIYKSLLLFFACIFMVVPIIHKLIKLQDRINTIETNKIEEQNKLKETLGKFNEELTDIRSKIDEVLKTRTLKLDTLNEKGLIPNQNLAFEIKNKLAIQSLVMPFSIKEDNTKVIIQIFYTIYNWSSDLIFGSINPQKTEFKIKILSNQEQAVYTELEPNYPVLSPFIPHQQNRRIETHRIEIPFTEGMIIDVRGNLCLDCEDKNKDQKHKIDNKIKIQCQLLKQKNDKNEDVILMIPIKSPVSKAD